LFFLAKIIIKIDNYLHQYMRTRNLKNLPTAKIVLKVKIGLKF